MPLKKQGKYRFTDFEMDLARRTFTREGHPISLSPRTFGLLAILVVNAQRVVSKEVLMRTLGSDASVEESNLGQHIFLLQRALTGIDTSDKLILRIPGIGYKFTARVTELPPEPEPEPELIPEPLPVPDQEATAEIDEAHEVPQVPEFYPRFASFGSFEAEQPPKKQRRIEEPKSEHGSEADLDEEPQLKSTFFSKLRPSGLIQVVAILLIVALLAVVNWFAWKHFHPVRSKADQTPLRLILASFQNATGETRFDQSLKTALSVDLSQSPYLSVPPESRIEEALTALKISASQPISGAAASQICQRLSAQAYLTAGLRRLSHNYLVTVQAFNCATGKNLAETRGIADSADAVVPVLDKVAADIRKQLGEPHQSVASFSKPLFFERPASIEALKAYADASAFQRQGKSAGALQLFQRATFLDPKFALAYDALANLHANLGHADEAIAAQSKAFNFRDTVDDQTRFILIAAYHDRVTGDLQASLRNDKQWASQFPGNPIPLARQADTEIQLGSPVLALEPARRALALNPDNPAAYIILARAQMHLGQFQEATSTCEQAIRHQIDSVEIHQFLLQIAFLRLDEADIDEQISWATGKPEEPEMQLQQALIDFAEGRATAGRTIFQSVADRYRKQNQPEQATKVLAQLPRMQAELGLVESADTQLSRLPESVSSPQIPIAWAHIGETTRAANLLKRELAAHPSGTLWQQSWAPQVRAAIAMNQHQPQVAIDALAPTATTEQANFDLSSFQIPAMRGRAYLALKQPDKAEAEFHKILDHPGIEPLSYNYPLAQLGLARSLAAQGKTTEAGFAYKIVLQIWKEADTDLPRLKEARAEYVHLNASPFKTLATKTSSVKTPTKPKRK